MLITHSNLIAVSILIVDNSPKFFSFGYSNTLLVVIFWVRSEGRIGTIFLLPTMKF